MRFTRLLLIAALFAFIAAPLFSPLLSVQADCTSNGGNNFHADNPVGQTCPGMTSTDNNSNILTNEGTVDNGSSSTMTGANNTAGGAITNTITNSSTVTSTSASILIGGNSSGANGGDVTNLMTNAGDIIVSSATSGDAYIDGGTLSSPSGNVTNIITNTNTIEAYAATSAEAYILSEEATSGTSGNFVATITNSGNMIAEGGTSDSYAGLYGGFSNGSGNATYTITNSGSLHVTSSQGNAFAEMNAGDALGISTVTNVLINNSTMFAQGAINGTALFDGGENTSATASVNNLFINNNLMDAEGGTATAFMYPNEGGTNIGPAINTLINAGTMEAGIAGGSSHSETYLQGSDNHVGAADVSNTLINSGTMMSMGTTANTYIKGGDNYSTSGTVTNTISVEGTIIANGVTDHASLTPANPANLSSYPGVFGGNNNSTSGSVTNTITVNGAVFGNIVGGTNSGSGTTTNTTTLTGYAPTVNGTIYGDGRTVAQGGALDQLFFEMSTTNEGVWDQWKAEIAAYGGSIPTSGSIIWAGKTYTWENLDELQSLVQFMLIVTWFNPGDNRVDPKAGDHIAAYCNIKDDTVGVYVINGDSVGQALTAFSIGDLRKAGSAGVNHNLGAEGIVSLSVDPQNNFWLAWNGGPLNANGQGDFAKGFNCAFS